MTGLLQRMIQRPGADAPDVPLTAARAVKRSVTQVAQNSLGLVLDIDDVSERTGDLDTVLAGLSDDLLMLHLIRGGVTVGLLTCDAQLVAVAIETLTTGQVAAVPGAVRPITNTDMALILPFLQGVISELDGSTVGTALDGWSTGCDVGARLADRRAVGFALTEQSYRVIGLTVNDRVTDRRPVLSIVLPNPAVSVAAPTAPPALDAAQWKIAMQRAVNSAPAALDVIVHRMPVPLSRLTEMAVGDCLPLHGCTIGAVRLEAPGGMLVARGRLGQMAGRIAVRIEQPDDNQMQDLPHREAITKDGHAIKDVSQIV